MKQIILELCNAIRDLDTVKQVNPKTMDKIRDWIKKEG